MSSLYGTDIGEENRQLVKSLAEHITYSKSRTVGKPLILYIRFFSACIHFPLCMREYQSHEKLQLLKFDTILHIR